MKRALYLALTVLMLLSLTLIAMTGCNTDDETDTTAATESATQPSGESEGESGAESESGSSDLSDMDADSVLTITGENLGSALSQVVTAKLKEFKGGNVNFAMPADLRIDLSGTCAQQEVRNGEDRGTTNISYTGAIVLSESGISLEFSVPNMWDASATCVGNTIYACYTENGDTPEKYKVTISDKDAQAILEMLGISGSDGETETDADIADSLNGILASMTGDELSKEQLEQLKVILKPFTILKSSDIFQSLTTETVDGNTTVTCKGIKPELVESVKKAVVELFDMFNEEEAAATEAATTTGNETETELVVPDELDQVLESIDATKWDDISFSLTVDAKGNIVGASVDLNLTVMSYWSETERVETTVETVTCSYEEIDRKVAELNANSSTYWDSYYYQYIEPVYSENGDDEGETSMSWAIVKTEWKVISVNKEVYTTNVSLKATVTVGAQKVSAPADVDSYEEKFLFPDDGEEGEASPFGV